MLQQGRKVISLYAGEGRPFVFLGTFGTVKNSESKAIKINDKNGELIELQSVTGEEWSSKRNQPSPLRAQIS